MGREKESGEGERKGWGGAGVGVLWTHRDR